MGSVTVARTVVCPLQMSQKKASYLDPPIAEFQDCCAMTADMMPSIDRQHWGSKTGTVYRAVEDQVEREALYAGELRSAVNKVSEAFDSRTSNGHTGELPSFGDGDYIRMDGSACGLSDDSRVRIVDDGDGYGLYTKINLDWGGGRWGDPEWFKLRGGEYQHDALDLIVAGNATLGDVEIHRDPTSQAAEAHISYTRECVVPDGSDVPRYVGVDLGERTLYALAVRNGDGDVLDVAVKTGQEQRHHRERLLARQQRRQQSGSQQRATGVSDRERYTEQVTHTASREIVDLAAEYAPCGIVLEDLTGYRESAQNPIHDWPYGMLQEQIAYKAKAAQIPVTTVDPEYTSLTCRRCDVTNSQSRNGIEFQCVNCDYQVNADVNAAMNLAAMGDEADW